MNTNSDKILQFALLFIMGAVSIQTALASGESPLDRYVAQFSERLNLTEEQTKRVRPILAANAAAMMGSLQKRNEERADEDKDKNQDGRIVRKERKMGGEMQEIRSNTADRLENILTPEQMAEYRKMQDEDTARAFKRIQARRNQ